MGPGWPQSWSNTRQRALLQSLEVIAALQDQDHPSLTDRVRQDFEVTGDGGESVPSDAHAGQGVFQVGIEAGRYQHQLGPVGLGNRKDDVLEEPAVGGISGAGGEGKVEGEPLAGGAAGFREGSRARKKGILMGGDEQDIFAVVKGLLSAIPVVDVEVNHQDALQPEAVQGVGGAQGHVAEEAKTHGPVGFGVVSRRPDKGKAIVDLARHQGLDHLQDPAHRMNGHLITGVAYGRVGVEIGEGFAGAALNVANVGGGVGPDGVRSRWPVSGQGA